MMKLSNYSLLPFALFGFFLAARAGSTIGAEKITVQSVNYPLHYFASRLATADFEVKYLVEPGIDPAFWAPDDTALEEFQKADLILKNGADYEKWMATVTLSPSKMLDTSRSFSKDYIHTKGAEHRHGDGTVHSHGGTVFTTWIDFSQASAQATAVAERFKKMKPESAEVIDEKLVALKEDLDALDASMKTFGKKWGDAPLVASHPIYQYFARAYGLSLEALEWEPEMTLEPKNLSDLKKLLAAHPATWMIWEDEPSSENIAAIRELGVRSVVFSPCANQPETGDWLTVMKQNLKSLESLFPSGE
ncbi:MAG: zinc ABC transporter substrate-binding protein [Verrucomicrobiales bacterium]|nr:zinc ABC transporter substrate-binding protein [Verrucomicrobiales bacterium]